MEVVPPSNGALTGQDFHRFPLGVPTLAHSSVSESELFTQLSSPSPAVSGWRSLRDHLLEDTFRSECDWGSHIA
ncbi:hypothetical protein ABIE13_001929 [Ottowia thiooxydans]|uniref:Uncharacterized protein n=1 Tax=Ottowia thiooxydans TaxID=219182 RepID=A0ABV2Q746_9BURK